jgi:undecaprenyl phosphate-alpha-L-ara4N flippase subunit ArnE
LKIDIIMLRLLLLVLIQSVFLCGGQVLMKLALKAAGDATLSWQFILSQLTNWWWLGCGMSFTIAGVMWMYILKHYPFSQAYPLSSMAYIMGMIAAMLVFHEQIVWTQWIGILLIMAGCYMVVH